MLRKLWIFCLFLGMAWADPSVEYFSVSEGVGGSIAPKPLTFQMLILGPDLYYKKLEGDSRYRCWRKPISDQETALLLKDLKKLGTFDLPQLPPDEMDDIYQEEVALLVMTKAHRWTHRPPVGCVRTRSPVQTSPEQRKIFKLAVNRVKELAQGGRECPPQDMDKAWERVYK